MTTYGTKGDQSATYYEITMDDADRAQERIDNVVAGGIAIAREKANAARILRPCGTCYYCNSTINAGAVFCPDDDCDEDWHHEYRRKKDMGLL